MSFGWVGRSLTLEFSVRLHFRWGLKLDVQITRLRFAHDGKVIEFQLSTGKAAGNGPRFIYLGPGNTRQRRRHDNLIGINLRQIVAGVAPARALVTTSRQ